jgi:DNA-binding transcriptional MerR regulator
MSLTMFTIGEFSRITGITVKALRFYHEEGLLTPASVDPRSGYRYYDQRNIERARAIALLRRLEFPVDEIKQVLSQDDRDGALIEAMERHKRNLEVRIGNYRQGVRSIDAFLEQERQASVMSEQRIGTVEERDVAAMLIAGVRMRGRYSECGKGFAQIGRKLGRQIAGKAMLLHYDDEYREEDADFEACMPVRPLKKAPPAGIAVRELPAGRCVTLLHRGPYDEMGTVLRGRLQVREEEGIPPDPADARGVPQGAGDDLQGESEELFDGDPGAAGDGIGVTMARYDGFAMKARRTWAEKLADAKGLPKVAPIDGKLSRRWARAPSSSPRPPRSTPS